MDNESFTVGMVVTLLVALISYGNAAQADTTTPTTQPQNESRIDGSVSRSSFTLSITDREPGDSVSQLDNTHSQIHYFTELSNMTGQTITHRWLYKDQSMAELTFTIGAPRWRVWSSKTLLPEWTGEWSVAVIDETGQELSRQSFEYEASDASAP